MDADPRQFDRRRRWLLAGTALLYLAAVGVVYALVDEATLQAALSLPLSLVAALFGLSLVNYVLRGWRWVVLGRHLGLRLPATDNLLYYFAGYSLTATPGKAGEAIRLWFLKFGHGVPYTRSLPLMLADRLLDAWAVLLLSLLSIAGFAAYVWHGAMAAAVVLLVSLPILFPRRLEPLLRAAYRRLPQHGRSLVRGRRLVRVMADLSSWRSYGLTLPPSVAGWFAEGAALYLLLQHFGADVSLANAVFIFSFAMIIGAISMLPGGLGSTEATMVILLKALGVDLGTALAATAIVRISTFWFAVGLGVLLTPLAMNAATRASRGLSPAAA